MFSDRKTPRLNSINNPMAFHVYCFNKKKGGLWRGGGVGFRDEALKIIVYGTDAPMRDPDSGYPSPGGCPHDATHALVVDAAQRMDTRLVGVAMRPNEATRSSYRRQDDASSSRLLGLISFFLIHIPLSTPMYS